MSIVPLALISGAAVDFSVALRAKNRAADSLDSATLAIARSIAEGSITLGEAEIKAEAIFTANMATAGMDDVRIERLSFDVDRTSGLVQSHVDASMPTSFMKLAGQDSIMVSHDSQAQAGGKDVELALMLDVTGSMGGQRIRALKSAAHELIDTLLPEGNPNPFTKTRIGLVPYSASVNAGEFAFTSTRGKSRKCVTERTGNPAYTDESYVRFPLKAKNGHCPKATVEPLTKDRAVLKNKIDGLKTGGKTAGHLGVAWSWYLLAPEWSDLWPGAAPVSYGHDKTNKIAILMTDGSFNQAYNNGSSAEQARRLCDNMKSNRTGIVVYSVAFQAPRDAADLLRNCATNESYFFDADNSEQLTQAFQTIAASVKDLRLIK